MMKVLLLGKFGQLGWELRRALAPLGELIALDFPDIDFSLLNELGQTVLQLKPQIIVNSVAYTAVDKAEEQAELAQTINGIATGVLAEAARRLDAALIHYSTDFVFDGTKNGPYTEADQPKPINAYGHSKWLGEQAIEQVGGSYVILRTSWMYSLRRDNYVKKVRQWARSYPTLRIVTDQIGNPTSARMLAEITAQLLAARGQDILDGRPEFCGIFHLGGDGSTSRFDFAREILNCDPHPEEHVFKEILPARTSEFPTPALRPLNSALNCEKFTAVFGLKLPPWQTALELMMEELSSTSVSTLKEQGLGCCYDHAAGGLRLPLA